MNNKEKILHRLSVSLLFYKLAVLLLREGVSCYN